MSKKNAKARTNAVGLDAAKTKVLVESLNSLLATYQVHYQNLRGCHWNINGPAFFELHVKYEELYTKAQLVIDNIAERILTLEGRPLHTYSSYLKDSKVKEQKDLTGAKATVACVMADMTELIGAQRKVLELAGRICDEATSTLMGDNITVMEKDLWMLCAYSGN
jgi:starvation-inducible DNA-binding protein